MQVSRLAYYLFVALILAMTGCVSTTTGPARSEPDDNNAALQYYQLGSRYFHAGNFELARDRLQRALEFNPRMGIAHSTLALTYERLEIPRLADEHYRLAVRYEPSNIDARNAYAVYLCRQRDFDEAREQFDRVAAIRENDNAEQALTNAGVCMTQRPDLEAAEHYFRAALDRKSNYPEALLQMTLLKRRAGDHLSARAFLQRYFAVQPTSPALLWLAIQLERDIGNESAQRDYEVELLEQFPDSPEAQRLRDAM